MSEQKKILIQELHERYVEEIVEQLNLCPFSRKARLDGHVHRVMHDVDAAGVDVASCARELVDLVTAHPEYAIVLLTFPVALEHVWQDPEVFHSFKVQLHNAFDVLDGPLFHMVCFHPHHVLKEGVLLNHETLIPLLRRTPDPVIQCVRASILDAMHAEADVRARQERVKEVAHMLGSGMTESMRETIYYSEMEHVLSRRIARHNFLSVGEGVGRAQFDAAIDALLTSRYALED